MPDDDHLGGTRSGDPHGYGRRHRREQPDEQPRRRRRSMEDNGGGLSVADLVQRHTGSRANLPLPPQPPAEGPPQGGGRRALPPNQPPRGRPGESAPGRQGARPGELPPNGRGPAPQPGDGPRRAAPHAADGYQADAGRAPAAPPRSGAERHASGPHPVPGAERHASGPHPIPGAHADEHPGNHPNGRPGGRAAVPPPNARPNGRRAAQPQDAVPPLNGHPAEARPSGRRAAAPQDAAPPPNGRPAADARPSGRRAAVPPDAAPHPRHGAEPLPADELPPGRGRPAGRRPGEATGGPQPNPVRRAPGQTSGHYRPGEATGGPLPGDRGTGRPQAGPLPGGREAPTPPPASHRPGRAAGPADLPDPGGRPPAGRPVPGRRPTPDTGDFPSNPPLRHPGPSVDDRPSGPPRRPGPDDRMPGPGRHPNPVDDRPADLPRRPGPDDRMAGPGRHPGGPSVDDRPSGPPRRPGPDDRIVPPGRRPGGPEADLPPGARASGIGHALDGQDDDGADLPGTRAPGQQTGRGPVPLPPPRRPDEDPISMTTEMEAIGEEVQKRRSIDHTLARFSAVHDEIQAEEREKKSKRRKLRPWQQQDAEFDHLDELVASQTIAAPQNISDEPGERDQPDEDADDEPVSKLTRLRRKKSKRRNRSATAGRAFAIVAAGLVFLSTGVGWGFKSWIEAKAQQIDALDPNSAAIQDAAAQRGDENFLLVGSDTRAGASAEDGVGDENSVGGARSDTVMVAHIPENRERVVVVSFPRDLEVTRPECEIWDPKTGEYTGKTDPGAEVVKLNTAYQVGGPKCVTKLVQELSGLAINHFVGIDFNGFKEMVDAVDGVEVCVEEPMKDDELGMIIPTAGERVTISGDQALNFVRARKVEGDITSDYGRIQRQQRFMSSLLRKAMSSEVLLDPGKLTGFLNAFGNATFGDNIGVEQMFMLGQSMQGIEAGKVTFITVPTVGEANENGNEDLLVEDNNALFEAIRQDTPLPGETSSESGARSGEGESPNAQMASGLRFQQQGQPTTVDPTKIKIQVLNGGNDQDGIAGDTADELAELGFQVVWMGGAPADVDRTVIKFSKVKQAEAQTLAAAVPDAQLVEDPAVGGALQLIIGPGFDGEVGSPTGKEPVELPENLSTVNAGDVSCA
ncbi:LCP family protein [Actinophytocola gossypii]|uniref:LCP family protein n=1 Tax=Actinophytocola gossypii TaxID=2812003 RepID=A0ABT2JEH0_9PSEU|nr:LCP family protein [Actinophytocola gossypii]MCT2585919.1 LCP family protein [Actinophytocola gossypii]